MYTKIEIDKTETEITNLKSICKIEISFDTEKKTYVAKSMRYIDGEVVEIEGRGEFACAAMITPSGEKFMFVISRKLAKNLGKYMFTNVRVKAVGHWLRNEEESWDIEKFELYDFEPFDDKNLVESIADLQEIEGKDWQKMADPVNEARARNKFI